MELAEEIEAVALDKVTGIEPMSCEDAHAIMRASFKRSGNDGKYELWDTDLDRTLDQLSTALLREVQAHIATALDNKGAVKILEQGCGDGSALKKLCGQLIHERPGRKVMATGVAASLKRMKWKSRNGGRSKTLEMKARCADAHLIFDENPEQFDLIFSDNTYQHLPFSWLTWGKTCQQLAESGVAVVRKLPNHLWTLESGKPRMVYLDDYIAGIRAQNPGHKITGEVDAGSERFGIVAVQRTNGDLFHSGLHFGKLKWKSGTLQPCSVFIPPNVPAGDFAGIDEKAQ